MSSDNVQYRIPVDGYYAIRSRVAIYKPTGKMTPQPNPKYRWWKFWLPKTILQPEYVVSYEMGGSDVKYLKAGDTVPMLYLLYRIGN
jgi:hypothetical protein